MVAVTGDLNQHHQESPQLFLNDGQNGPISGVNFKKKEV